MDISAAGPVAWASRLVPSALTFAQRCHDGQQRDSGAPFIEHPREVARLLHEAGCSETLVAAGLLHDLLEDTHVEPGALRARFGPAVAQLVETVSDDAGVAGYRQRKRKLREQVRSVGGDAALLFAADKISKVREASERMGRGDRRSAGELERHDELRLEHYAESLRMLQDVAPRHSLVELLAAELDEAHRDRRGVRDRRAPVSALSAAAG